MGAAGARGVDPLPRRVHRAATGAGHVQSLILGAVLFIAAMLLGALGVIGDLLAAQRTLSQRTFERVRRIELELGVAPSHYEPGATTDARPRERRSGRRSRYEREAPSAKPSPPATRTTSTARRTRSCGG